jgi:hypothetical protein
MCNCAGGPTNIVNQIHGWLSACDHEHDCVARTQNPQGPNQKPAWIIDTHLRCITAGTDADRYLALSYVWPENDGNARDSGEQPVRLDKRGFWHFRLPGALGDANVVLPPVLQDAISLTNMLRERYLWVDRLCIVQDDDSTVSEVMKMDQIYSNAYLTIIAAGSHGLLTPAMLVNWNQRCASATHSLPTNSVYASDECRPLNEHVNKWMMDHYKKLSESRWATRGWTYQEQILSNRSVIFQDDEVFWECNRSVWDGHRLLPGIDGRSTEEASKMGMRLSELRLSDFSLYVDLICFYNHRDFSFPQDAIAAISGILNVLTPAFPGGFLGALPISFLDYALLWQPLRKASRRRRATCVVGVPAKEPTLPSWSWCGWQCLVDPWSLQSGIAKMESERYPTRAGNWKTQNLIAWSITTPEMSVPVPIDQVSGNIIKTPQWLHCTTTRRFFRPGAVLGSISSAFYLGASKFSAFEHPLFTTRPEPHLATSIMVLQDMFGRRCGLLRLMDDNRDYDCWEYIELIAISKGSCTVAEMSETLEYRALWGLWEWPGTHDELVYGPTWIHRTLKPTVGFERDAWGRLPMPPSLLQGTVTYNGKDDLCEFYNVLWVETTDGIAYRRACGRIATPVWEADGYEEVEVVLG